MNPSKFGRISSLCLISFTFYKAQSSDVVFRQKDFSTGIKGLLLQRCCLFSYISPSIEVHHTVPCLSGWGGTCKQKCISVENPGWQHLHRITEVSSDLLHVSHHQNPL